MEQVPSHDNFLNQLKWNGCWKWTSVNVKRKVGSEQLLK